MIREYIIKISDEVMEEDGDLIGTVPQLIRCKDCLYKNNTGISNQWLPCMDTNYPDNFYCGRGERKGGDMDG